MPTPPRRLLTVPAALALLAGPGCHTALREALQRAEAAHLRGDHFGEALALRDGCRAEPDDVDICHAAKTAADEVVLHVVQTLEAPCSTDALACLNNLETLAPFAGAEDPRLTPWFDRAGAMLTQGCESQGLATNEDAVLLVRCMAAWSQRVPTATFTARLAQDRQRAAGLVDQLAARAAAEPGVAWLHESLAACLGGPAFAPNAATYRARFDDAHALRFEVATVGASDEASVCSALAGQFGTVARCVRPGQGGVSLAIDASLEPMMDAPFPQRKTVEVLDHVEHWENPDWLAAQARLHSASRTHQQAAATHDLAEADCRTARSALSRANSCQQCAERTEEESRCNRAKALDDIAKRARGEKEDAERAARRVERTLSREVYRTVGYLEITHRFRGPWRVRVSLGGGQPVERTGVMTFESTERQGVREANIAPIAYSEPSPAQRRDEVSARALELAMASVGDEFDRVGRQRAAACPSTTGWSECRVEAALFSRADPVHRFISEVGARVDAASAQPWPEAPCVTDAPR